MAYSVARTKLSDNTLALLMESPVTEIEQSRTWRTEAIAFLAIASIHGVGYWTMRSISERGISYWKLLNSSSQNTFEDCIKTTLSEFEEQDWDNNRAVLWQRGIEVFDSLRGNGIGLIFSGQEQFPHNLSSIPDRPYWLFIQGEISNLHLKSVAVIGSRKASDDGIFLTRMVIAALAGKGLPTISGLASGIDQIVHSESLRYGIPTVAVLGTGINQNYPKGSGVLRAEIIRRGGTIITEYLPNQTYSSENFVRRNRLQAALCDTLVPTEWNIKSGSAHTVEFASKFGKKIANVLLPLTYEIRPELKFSSEAYGAVSCVLPDTTDLLLQFINEELPTSYEQQTLDLGE